MNKKRRILIAVLLIVGFILAVGISALILLSVISRVINSSTGATSAGFEGYGSAEPKTLVSGLMRDAAIDDAYEMEESAVSQTADDYMSGPETAATVEQKIIKTASLTFVVDDVSDSVESITALTSEVGGFVQSSETWQSSSTQLRGEITVRVPADKFEQLLERSKELALVVSNESVSGQDVTEQYTDLAARLANAQKQEEELRRLLERAENVEEILKVQKQLNEAREEVEVLQGRMNYLENQTSLSTVTFVLREESSVELPTKAFRPLAAAKDAARALVTLAQGAVITLIWIVIVGGGILLPIIVLIWLLYRLVRHLYHKYHSKKTM